MLVILTVHRFFLLLLILMQNSFERSRCFDLEDGIALARGRQLLAGNSNGTNPDISGQIQRGQSSTSFYDTKVGKGLLQVANIYPIMWCAYKITADPFFLYYHVIYDDIKCYTLDELISNLSRYLDPLGIAINVVGFCSLVINVIMNKGLLTNWFEKIVWLVLILIDVWSYITEYLPYRQSPLMLQLVWPFPGISNFYSASIFLAQYFATVCLMYVAFIRATKMSATLARATWAKAAFNLLLYLHGGHAFGGLWYAFAVVKYTDCWKEACKKYAWSSYCTRRDFFSCSDVGVGNGIVDYTTLNEMCPTKIRNTTIYDFGIYYDALESGIVNMSPVYKRILHCLRWGLQNLSGFGQNLQVSADAWENIFVISITIYGLVLFVFFIGNMQIYLQLNTQRSEKIRNKKREIEKSKSFAKLSKNLQKDIKRYQPKEWEETNDAHFKNLFNNVPDDIKKDIKNKLCLEIVKKVEEFNNWSNEMLEELCDCAKPVSYTQYAQIIQKGNIICEMLFFVHGKLRTYSWQPPASASTREQVPPSASTQEQASLELISTAHTGISFDHLADGKFCGEELVKWFRDDPYSSNLPKSIKTIQTLTKVDAFVLMSYDLQNLFIKHRAVSASTQEQSPASACTQEQSPATASTQEQLSASAFTQEQAPLVEYLPQTPVESLPYSVSGI